MCYWKGRIISQPPYLFSWTPRAERTLLQPEWQPPRLEYSQIRWVGGAVCKTVSKHSIPQPSRSSLWMAAFAISSNPGPRPRSSSHRTDITASVRRCRRVCRSVQMSMICRAKVRGPISDAVLREKTEVHKIALIQSECNSALSFSVVR